jgi:hypothetical protein
MTIATFACQRDHTTQYQNHGNHHPKRQALAHLSLSLRKMFYFPKSLENPITVTKWRSRPNTLIFITSNCQTPTTITTCTRRQHHNPPNILNNQQIQIKQTEYLQKKNFLRYFALFSLLMKKPVSL